MNLGDLLRFTLVGDGSSDRALLPVLSWLIRDLAGVIPLEPQWANLGPLSPVEKIFPNKIRKALEDYPCHILFVHRDSERTDLRQKRVDEIQKAILSAADATSGVPAVCVVPVRMMESWLLFDEAAIRQASGRPRGKIPLSLPTLNKMEQVHAKDVLHEAIRTASETTGRRARKLDIPRAVQQVAENIADFGQLKSLPAFLVLRSDLARALQSLGFACSPL